MTYKIPNQNWPEELAKAVADVVDGDEIQVNSMAKKELAERALSRINPDVKVTVTVSK